MTIIKKLLAILSVFLLADQASAEELTALEIIKEGRILNSSTDEDLKWKDVTFLYSILYKGNIYYCKHFESGISCAAVQTSKMYAD